MIFNWETKTWQNEFTQPSGGAEMPSQSCPCGAFYWRLDASGWFCGQCGVRVAHLSTYASGGTAAEYFPYCRKPSDG